MMGKMPEISRSSKLSALTFGKYAENIDLAKVGLLCFVIVKCRESTKCRPGNAGKTSRCADFALDFKGGLWVKERAKSVKVKHGDLSAGPKRGCLNVGA